MRSLRITAGAIAGLIEAGRTTGVVLDARPDLECQDVPEALSYAAWGAVDENRSRARLLILRQEPRPPDQARPLQSS
jgi:uncharacterized protein (DUF433 family)